MTTLSYAEARRVYDRIGALQDTQAFYEDRATDLVVAHGRFETAERVFELGHGTGRFAARLLTDHLPPSARYEGIDLSSAMVTLATARLARFAERASVALTDGALPLARPAHAYDRFVANFVLDLLSDDDIDGVVREARRMLAPGGYLCLASLSTGHGVLPRLAARVWAIVHAVAPTAVGGCRPIDLRPRLSASDWRIRVHEHLAPFGIPSEVVVAERR